MRRRRSSDPLGDTASNLGNAMDELMRHQPSLKESATSAIIKLLEEVCAMGRDPKYVCWKASAKTSSTSSEQNTGTNTDRNVQSNQGNEGGSSDEEEEEVLDEEQASNQASEQPASAGPSAPPSASPSSSCLEKEPVPLVDYIHNVMKFVDAILSNNSTDDHCREFVSQKGLVPLMGILGLPNLPIDFPSHQACQAVAAVSKSILTLAHEPQVLKQGLLHLNEVLKSLEPLHTPLPAPGGSVLLRELVSSSPLSGIEATSNPQATPLLHSMSAAHAYIQMFVHVCRTGQNDIRSVAVAHWGSELGLAVLKGLSRLYTSLVWESTVLLALCSEDTLPVGCEFGKSDMEKLLPPKLDSKTENEETFSPASGTSADSNSSVTAAMENLSTEPEVMGMEVDSEKPKQSSTSSPVSSYQIKQIKPLLSESSRLGRSLAELFALLVKLCVGSPLRQRRGQQHFPAPPAPSAPAKAVASALTRLLAEGLSWEPPSTSPIPRFRLTFFICSVGFTAPMLFDEKKFPYHLMLMKFISSGGQKAFFDTFYWAISIGGTIDPEQGLESPELPEGTGEFLDSWLLLLEKMVNPKTVLESPHTLPAKNGNLKPFDPMKYLARTHKMAFHAVMTLWGKKPLKVYGSRMTETFLSVLCHILKGEKLIEEKEKKDKMDTSMKLWSEGSTSSTATTEPDLNPEQLQWLMDMGFPRERCIEAINNTGSIDQAADYLLNNPPLPPLNAGASGSGAPGSQGGEQDELMRAIAMSLGENVMVSSDSQSGSQTKTEEQEEEEKLAKEDFQPLEKSVIDEFTNSSLQGCLNILDTLPDIIYSVNDLLLAVFNRNGKEFKMKVLSGLAEEVAVAVSALRNLAERRY